MNFKTKLIFEMMDTIKVLEFKVKLLEENNVKLNEKYDIIRSEYTKPVETLTSEDVNAIVEAQYMKMKTSGENKLHMANKERLEDTIDDELSDFDPDADSIEQNILNSVI